MHATVDPIRIPEFAFCVGGNHQRALRDLCELIELIKCSQTVWALIPASVNKHTPFT